MSKSAVPVPNTESANNSEPRKRPFRLRFHSWVRWLHTYVSMFTLIVVLFFSITGITLNHPEWTFGIKEVQKEFKGKLDPTWMASETPNWLAIAEHFRKEHGVRGLVADNRIDDQQGSVGFKAPGYSADCMFDRKTGEYTVTEISDGALSAMNDLHRGRDSGKAWSWVVDLSGYLLTFISVTGLAMIFYLKKVKVKALVTAAMGLVILIILMKLALGS